MPKLDVPTGLGLTDPEAGRESDQLRITFDLVADATSYELTLNGAPWSSSVAPGDWITPLTANTAHAMSIVARASGFDDSDPSVAVTVLTRPPTPSTLQRAPIDLSGWGIVLDWNEPDGWNGAILASVLLRRSSDSKPPVTIAKSRLEYRHIDTRYPLGVENIYDTLIAVPNPLGGPDNLSRAGISVSARGPFQLGAIGGANRTLTASQDRSERLARALLGLRQ